MGNSDTKRLYRDFWEAFSDRVEALDETPLYVDSNLDLSKNHLPQKQNLLPQINYSFVSNTNRDRLEVKLHIRGKKSRRDRLYPHLKKQRDDIEDRLDEELNWSRKETYDKISLYRDGNVNNREQWDEYLDWFVTYGEAFHRVFGDVLGKFEK